MKTAQQTGGETLFEQLKKRKYGLIIPIYAMIYIPWFYYLERTVQNPTHIIHLAIDDYIPFIDVFIIPYMLWFGYISATVLWLLWKDKKEYLQLITFLIIGIFHPMVTKGEYYFGVKIWWLFLVMGIAAVAGSIAVRHILWSTLLAVWGASSLWSIGELFEQRERVAKGWFPKNPKRK